MVINSGKGAKKGFIKPDLNGNRIRNIKILLKYIEGICKAYEISEHKFNMENGLAISFISNLRRIARNDPNAYQYKISFDMLVNLSLRYGVPFLASDYLDTLGNYPNNYLHKKTESNPNKLAKKTTKAPPKPKFI